MVPGVRTFKGFVCRSRSTRAAPWARRPRGRLWAILLVSAAFGGALFTTGCGSVMATSSGKLQVVAAENFWGSIAAQLGGEKVQVRSIVVSADTDPAQL